MAEAQKKKIVLVHYHLRRGGVTRVIDAAAKVLEARGHQVLILTGEAPFGDGEKETVRVVPALAYRRTGSSVIASSLADMLRREAKAHFGSEPDLWHFHNPTLAKNVLFPNVVRELAEEGGRVLLQLHDFAEDGRPGNYTNQRSFFDSEDSFETTMYPVAKQIHYATINHRDHGFLKKAGMAASNLHVLPNSISKMPVEGSREDRPFAQGKLFGLYPSRGIRRKNVGELLLLSMIHEGKAFFASSLSPENPEWRAGHDQWVAAVEELQLPVALGIADSGEYSFAELVGWSDFIITTSVAEGFGLAFLEPWTVGKGVLGRDLPEITRDFAEKGLRLENLYSRLDIPLAWLDEKKLKSEIESALRRSYLAYDVPLRRSAVKQTWKSWVRKGKVDFGVLNEGIQLSILRKLREEPDLIREIEAPPLELPSPSKIESANAVIAESYSLDRYGDRLEGIYEKVVSGSRGKVDHLSTDKVLAQFLNPGRLNLLRD
jgi:glycosyltransferase involved in cell wall biosynthesis